MVDRTGQQLGHYRLVRLLGRGGFAEVYLGEHLRLKTQAAIKVLYTALEEDDIESFLREAQTVARLKHPHIVRVFDFDVQDHTPYLVMDYLPNGNVRRSHPKGTVLPLETIVSYVQQVASALQYAHDQQLIHRDVKPENMLLDQDNSIVLSDFGIALMAQSSRYRSTQEVAGTAAYMAPEQFQGHPHRASDQYALGVVVYEWLSGDKPFHGTFSEIASQHMFVQPPPLHEKVPTLSTTVEQVVLTALEKDPHKRFATIQAFATALEQACQPAPAHQVASPTEVPPSNEPSLPSETVATVLPTQLPQPTNVVTPPSQSLQPTDVATPSSSLPQPTIAATPIPTPAVSPPSTEEPIPSSRPQPSKHRISRRAVVAGLAGVAIASGSLAWLVLFQRPQGSSLSPHPTATLPPTPSPTPTHSGPSMGTTPLLTYRGHSAQVLAVAWSPDGKHIASTSVDATVQVWDAITGKNILIYHGHLGEVLAVVWSPDGKRIASGGGDHTVQVWDAATGGNVLTYQGHSDALFDVDWSPNGKNIASASVDKTVQYGTPLQEEMFLPIVAIQMWYGRQSGPLMASVSLLEVARIRRLITQCRYGMPLQEEMFLPIKAIPLWYLRWRGHRPVSTSLPAPMIRRCRCGMLSLEVKSSPIKTPLELIL